MSDEPRNSWRWIGIPLALTGAALGAFLVYAAYSAGLPYNVDIEDLNPVEGAVVAWSAFGIGLLLIAVCIRALIRE